MTEFASLGIGGFEGAIFILLTTILVENVVLAQFLGICPFLGVSKQLNSAVGMSLAVTFVMGLADAVCWPLYQYILVPRGLEYLETLTFILVIAALVQLVEFILKKYIKPLYQALGVYLPLITTNCAVLGITLNNISNNLTFGQSMVCSIGSGLGFLVAMVLFAGVRSKMEYSDITKNFQGVPITLVAASIVSMSFTGFAGMAKAIFGL